jgi:anthranilate/para-aminobenzoate synthase component I
VVALAYDAGRNLERVPATAREDPPLPDVVLARYPAFVEGPGPEGPWTVVGPPAARDRLLATLSGPASAPGPPPEPALRSSMDRAAHCAALEQILRGIRAGDLYQANVARRLEAPFDPATTPGLYRSLRRANPAAYGALWALDDGTWLASSSPECLLTFSPETRAAHSYPIKGTRPRGADPAEDQALACELTADAKERAEHVMIVDLVRNDLGRVAVIGSVGVDRLFDVMTLPTVHHLVSDVRATVAPERDLADLVSALFPGGSITGAPKIAAMSAIEAVEGLRRGFYTGSLGVVTGDGEACFNILIRTCVAADGRLFYQTGGGIVADSDPDREWAETEAKAAALPLALRGVGVTAG